MAHKNQVHGPDCDHDHDDEFEIEVVTLEDENGERKEYAILEEADFERRHFAVLAPLAEVAPQVGASPIAEADLSLEVFEVFDERFTLLKDEELKHRLMAYLDERQVPGKAVSGVGSPTTQKEHPLLSPNQMNQQWYYAQNGQQIGPVSGEHLRALLSSGSVRNTDLVWMDSLPAWTPAGQVAALQPPPAPCPALVNTSPPPPMPASPPTVLPLDFTYPLESVLAELRDSPYRIGVFGEFSTGKSTFLNALMGEDLLSVATEPTTAIPTRIQYARAFNVIVFGKPAQVGGEPSTIASLFPSGAEPVWARLMKDGILATLRHETSDIRRFLERWTKEGQDADKTHEVVIQLPQPFLKGRIALIDTPGVNNEFTQHQGITERVLENVDLALCLVDARQGGKASEMQFIRTVVGRAALTRVVVNKIDLIDENEREDLLEAIHGTLKGFWPTDRGLCPEPWAASSLASLEPEFQSRFPMLAESFNILRENLKGLAETQRPKQILARCGNWDQARIRMANEAINEERFAEAHECLLDVLTLCQEAELDVPDGLLEQLQCCEDGMKGTTSRINEAHSLVDRAALILLRADVPTDEVKDLLRQAGEIFFRAQVRDSAFEKLAKQALGSEATKYLYIAYDPEAICDEAKACLVDGKSDAEFHRAVNLIKPLAEQGFVRAQSLLGLCYLEGLGVVQDPTNGVKWICKAAEQGYSKGQWALGRCYYEGTGVTQNFVEAVNWFRKAAEQGNEHAQTFLGFCYSSGTGVTQSHVEAANWYRKAADQGEPAAQRNLGTCYVEGHGVDKDPIQGVDWYLKAAEQGYADAQNALGYCYAQGIGVPLSLKNAAVWYQKAAEQGHAEAQYNLGTCFSNGNGVVQDRTEARKWLKLSSDQGHEAAINHLKSINNILCDEAYQRASEYFNNNNENDGFKLIHEIANIGHVESQNKLAWCYMYGKGCPIDKNEAIKWYKIAANNGHQGAIYSLSKLGITISPPTQTVEINKNININQITTRYKMIAADCHSITIEIDSFFPKIVLNTNLRNFRSFMLTTDNKITVSMQHVYLSNHFTAFKELLEIQDELYKHSIYLENIANTDDLFTKLRITNDDHKFDELKSLISKIIEFNNMICDIMTDYSYLDNNFRELSNKFHGNSQ